MTLILPQSNIIQIYAPYIQLEKWEKYKKQSLTTIVKHHHRICL